MFSPDGTLRNTLATVRVGPPDPLAGRGRWHARGRGA